MTFVWLSHVYDKLFCVWLSVPSSASSALPWTHLPSVFSPCPWKAVCSLATLCLSDQVASAGTRSHCHLSRACPPLTPSFCLSLYLTHTPSLSSSHLALPASSSLRPLCGHHTPSVSTLFPPLSSLSPPRLFPLSLSSSVTLSLHFFYLFFPPCHLSSCHLFITRFLVYFLQ